MIIWNLGGGTPAAGTPEKAENGSAKRGGWPKGKKRKKIPRDQTAPRQPLTGKKINSLSKTYNQFPITKLYIV